MLPPRTDIFPCCPRCCLTDKTRSSSSSDRTVPPDFPDFEEIICASIPFRSYILKVGRDWARCLLAARRDGGTHQDVKAWVGLMALANLVLRRDPEHRGLQTRIVAQRSMPRCKRRRNDPDSDEAGADFHSREARATTPAKEGVLSNACSTLRDLLPAPPTEENLSEMRNSTRLHVTKTPSGCGNLSLSRGRQFPQSFLAQAI